MQAGTYVRVRRLLQLYENRKDNDTNSVNIIINLNQTTKKINFDNLCLVHDTLKRVVLFLNAKRKKTHCYKIFGPIIDGKESVYQFIRRIRNIICTTYFIKTVYVTIR